ncbi:unnamed protein product [Closterium sp. Yama58-4]|nr:unnamed protein product [Closterium sp. Yama58-4]
MAAHLDYQSCRYSSWCPDRYDADEWYEAMDQQYAIDTSSLTSQSSTTATSSSYRANGGGAPASTMQASRHSNYYYYNPASTTITTSGRTSTMMPLNTMMTVCEDQPPIASAAAAASVPRVLIPAVAPVTNGDTSPAAEAGDVDTSGRANVARRMMMMMPAAAADEEAAKLSSPFDWRELEASCRKLDAANIRITELDITCLGSPTTSDSAFDAGTDGAFGSSGDSGGGGGGGGDGHRSHVQVRYGITCEPADTSSFSVTRPAINGGGGATVGDVGMMARQTHSSQPRHPTHIYGFPPVHHKLPPAAVHHMPLPPSVHMRRAQEVNTSSDRRHIIAHSAATNSSTTSGSERSRGNGPTNASDGHGSFSRPRSASTIAALSSIIGGSGGLLEGSGGSGTFSLRPSSGFGSTGSGLDSDPVSGWRFGPSPSRGAPTSVMARPDNDESSILAVLPESEGSDKAASSDSSDSVPVSCGSSRNSSSNATDTNISADAVNEIGTENNINTKTAGTMPRVHASSPDANSSVSIKSSTQGLSNTTNGTTSGSGGKSFSRVMRALADRCQRAFTITPGRGRALRMTAAVQHRRCNSSERLDQLHIAMT